MDIVVRHGSSDDLVGKCCRQFGDSLSIPHTGTRWLTTWYVPDLDAQELLANRTLDVNEANIAPAAEVVASPIQANTRQLTDAVIANLTVHELPGVSLFGFNTKPTTNANCKVFPGDADWPIKPIWSIFNLLIDNALIETVPIGAVCYPNSGFYSASACDDLLKTWTLSDTQ